MCLCVCAWGVETVSGAVKSALCHHHLIKHPNGRRSYLSKRETNEREATRGRAEGESENDIQVKNGVRDYVTGFQKTIEAYAHMPTFTVTRKCTDTDATHTHTHTHTLQVGHCVGGSQGSYP